MLYTGPSGPGVLLMTITETDLQAPPIPPVFTDSAANKVRDLLEEEGNAALKLRVVLHGGGCSGLQYGFSFDAVINDDDTAIDNYGVHLLIDPMSFQHLMGAEIDFK